MWIEKNNDFVKSWNQNELRWCSKIGVVKNP